MESLINLRVQLLARQKATHFSLINNVIKKAKALRI